MESRFEKEKKKDLEVERGLLSRRGEVLKEKAGNEGLGGIKTIKAHRLHENAQELHSFVQLLYANYIGWLEFLYAFGSTPQWFLS